MGKRGLNLFCRMPPIHILFLSNFEQARLKISELASYKDYYKVTLANLNWNQYKAAISLQNFFHFLIVHEPSINNDIQKIVTHYLDRFRSGTYLFINAEDYLRICRNSDSFKESDFTKILELHITKRGLKKEADFLIEGTKIAYKISAIEHELITHLASGKQAAEIADKMCLSVRTIETYTRNLLQKLNLRNRPHLIDFAYKNGLLP